MEKKGLIVCRNEDRQSSTVYVKHISATEKGKQEARKSREFYEKGKLRGKSK